MSTLIIRKTLVQLEIKETIILLALSVILPFFLHLAPNWGKLPLAAHLIPLFYAPFMAVILCRLHVAIIVALFSPFLNFLFTGYPVQEKLGMLTLELLLFSLIAYFISQRFRNFLANAVCAYMLSLFIVSLLKVYKVGFSAMNIFLRTLNDSAAGLAVLLLLNIFLERLISHK
jgi:hypothetical protein